MGKPHISQPKTALMTRWPKFQTHPLLPIATVYLGINLRKELPAIVIVFFVTDWADNVESLFTTLAMLIKSWLPGDQPCKYFGEHSYTGENVP